MVPWVMGMLAGRGRPGRRVSLGGGEQDGVSAAVHQGFDRRDPAAFALDAVEDVNVCQAPAPAELQTYLQHVRGDAELPGNPDDPDRRESRGRVAASRSLISHPAVNSRASMSWRIDIPNARARGAPVRGSPCPA